MTMSPYIVLGVILVVAIVVVGMVLWTIREVVRIHAREKSRRELAAYVAEGTVRPGDAVRMMAAGEKPEFEKSERGVPSTESSV